MATDISVMAATVGSSPDKGAGIVLGSGADWFGPGNPLPPVAPPEVAGRTFDFPQAINQQQRPRAYEPVSFEQLRMLANSFDILRTVIETRKDQIAGQDWTIGPIDEKQKIVGDLKTRVDALNALFKNPYPGMDWDVWLRAILEDMLVIDAATIYPRRTKGGQIFGFKPMDGGTIKRVIDDWADTPAAPAPAYQQVLKGMGAVNYTVDQLVYRPRNVRTNKIYGFGPVEQIIAIINIGLRRETWQLEFFTSGTMPDALIGTPNEWTPEQLRSFQDWFDARLAGNTGKRRGATFVPGEVAKGYVATKDVELFGTAEEWIARVVCYAFNLSPQAFMVMMNRATATTAKDTADEEGIKPTKKWVKSLIDFLLVTYLDTTDLEFKWKVEVEIDPQVQDTILVNDAASGLMTIDEVREAKGLDPSGIPEGSMLMIKTLSGLIPVSMEEQLKNQKAKQDIMPPPPPIIQGGVPGKPGAPGNDDQPPPNGKGPKPGKPPAAGGGKAPAGGGSGGSGGDGKAGKSAEPSPHAHHGHSTWKHKAVAAPANAAVSVDRPLGRRVAAGLTKALTSALSATGDDVAHQVVKKLNKLRGQHKAVDHGDGKDNDDRLTDIATGALTDTQIEDLIASLDLSSLDVITDAMDDGLYDLAADTAKKALAQVGVKATSALVDRVNTEAVDFARARSAELVGMRYNAAGDLVTNPNAKYAITDSTRDMLRNTIADGLEQNIGTDAIADAIQESFAFSAQRANLIAMTEVRNANEQSKLSGWRAAGDAGVTVMKSWQASNNENTCDVCQGNEADGAIALDADFSSGDDAAPAHPNCECITIPEVIEAGDSPGGQDD